VELIDFIDEQLQALDLHARTRKPIQYGAISKIFFQEFSQQNIDNLFVANHAAAFFNFFGLWRSQQIADHNRATRKTSRRHDESGVSPFP